MSIHFEADKEPVFNGIYRRYFQELYQYAFRIMRDKLVSEDIIQEVFMDFWRRMDGLDIQNHRAYLYKAVKYQCATRLKDRSFSDVQLDKIEFALTFLEDNDASQEVLKQTLLQRIESKAAEILPERCLHVFRLRYYENMSYSEIAQRMDISVRTVENQLNKALKLLRAEDLMIVLLLAEQAAGLVTPL